MDHNGRRIHVIRPEGHRNCDTKFMVNSGRPWFRFSGAAGTRLLDRCPPAYSCGADAAIWSDSVMPIEVGVLQSAHIYMSWNKNCRSYKNSISVMRCSGMLNDFIYRYDGSIVCHDAFCGMN